MPGGAKLYVPLTRMDLVQRFRGAGEAKPALDRMGGATWTRTKTRIKAKMRDMADELLKLYASRKMAEGFQFSPIATGSASSKTPSSSPKPATSSPPSHEIKRDMESPQPMDRLLVRRRRLRQDRSRHARRVQGLGRRQAGRRPGSYYSISISAFRDLQAALPALSGARGDVQPVPFSQGVQGRRWPTWRRARSTSPSAPTACSRRTSSSAISAW